MFLTFCIWIRIDSFSYFRGPKTALTKYHYYQTWPFFKGTFCVHHLLMNGVIQINPIFFWISNSFYMFFFICSFFIPLFFKISFFVRSFIYLIFIRSFFIRSFFITQNLLLQPNIKKKLYIQNMAHYLTHMQLIT